MCFFFFFLLFLLLFFFFFFFFNDTATTEIYTLSLHDALPISTRRIWPCSRTSRSSLRAWRSRPTRSEEHTSELQSRLHLVCRLLLEKKKKKNTQQPHYAHHNTISIRKRDQKLQAHQHYDRWLY